MFKTPTALAALLVLFGACSSPGTGELRVVFTDGAGATVAGRGATYDFGLVQRGATGTLPLIVQNAGGGTLTLSGFEFVQGDAVSAVPGVEQPSPVFAVALDAALDLPAGAQRGFELRFMPPAGAADGHDFSSEVLLRATGTAPGEDAARLMLTGVASADDPCGLPEVLDFAALEVSDTWSLSFRLSNSGSAAKSVTVGPLQVLLGGTAFSLASGAPSGTVSLTPGATEDVVVEFHPTEARDYLSELSVTVSGCAPARVRLLGTGVDQVLTWTPATVDFGYQEPGASVDRELTFLNAGLRPVLVSDLATFEGAVPSAVFSLPNGEAAVTAPPATRDDAGVRVPGQAVVRLRFAPDTLGPRAGSLRAMTDVDQRAVVVPLRAVGGGPDVELTPAPVVDFDRIAYFAGASPPAYSTLQLALRNVGTLADPPDPRAHLRLGVSDGAGGLVKPYWEVAARNASTSASELCVGVFDEASQSCTNDLAPGVYDPAVGLVAGAPGLSIPLRVTPQGVGLKEWQVRLFTNDPDEPVVTLTVRADVVVLPPCNFTVTPLALPFGVVAPGERKELSVRVRNNGTAMTDVCLLSNVEVVHAAPPPSPVFSVANAPRASVTLPPGDAREFVVRAAPTGVWPNSLTPVAGSLTFSVSNPVAPVVHVALTSEVGRGCLTALPEAWDFGTVQQSCGSPVHSVTFTNDCSTQLLIQQVDVPLEAGEPAGGPHCPGAAACPEFSLVSPPAVPLLVPAYGVATVQVQYRPINAGLDQGLLRVRTNEGNGLRAYTVPLAGAGDAQGRNTDAFSVPKKADVLLVIDDSGSLTDKTYSMAQRFGSFIQYATVHQVEYQIGVVPGTMPGTGELRKTAQGLRFARSGTADAPLVFGELVDVGIQGSGTETCLLPALNALTAPKVADPASNLGLVREDASLGIVCVTDAQEQSVNPPAWYLDRLRAVKGTQHPEWLTYSAIAGFLPQVPPSGCRYDGSPDDGKHAYAAAQLHGTTEEICTSDWAATMERVGRVAFGQRDAVFLRARPDPMGPPITLSLDGVPVPAMQGAATVWTYDPVDNGVHFTPNYVPVVGQSVVVSYQVACLP